MKVSIIIPCFNEEKTLSKVVEKVMNFKSFDKEVIIVDDCSKDNTQKIINDLVSKFDVIKSIRHDKNYGKGEGIKSGVKVSTGDIILIQDADLEYNPEEFDILLKPFLETNADVVYGSRFLGGEYVKLSFFWHYVANKILTLFCNIFTNLNMTDMETGYKAFKKDVIKSIYLYENSFGFEPEVTIKLSKKKYKFFEVPVSYVGRSYDEGKKIKLKDAFIAFYCIIKYGIK